MTVGAAAVGLDGSVTCDDASLSSVCVWGRRRGECVCRAEASLLGEKRLVLAETAMRGGVKTISSYENTLDGSMEGRFWGARHLQFGSSSVCGGPLESQFRAVYSLIGRSRAEPHTRDEPNLLLLRQRKYLKPKRTIGLKREIARREREGETQHNSKVRPVRAQNKKRRMFSRMLFHFRLLEIRVNSCLTKCG